MAGDHKCLVCNATFTRPQHVARHMRSHTGDRPYKCQHCGDQFARSDLLSRHVNKCHASEKSPTTTVPNRRKGSASASRATTSKQACDQCVLANLPCDGCNSCSKCISRKSRCTYVKFHRQTAPMGPGHPAPPGLIEKSSQLPNFSTDAVIPSDEYLLSHPHNLSGSVPAVGGVGLFHSHTMPSTDFTFPASMYSRSSSLPSNAAGSQHHSPSDQSSPDFASRYRAQAELLSRAGILSNGQMNLSGPVGQGSPHTHTRMGMGIHSLLGVQQPTQQTHITDQRYPLSSASWGPYDPTEGVVYHPNRPHSQPGYPGSLPTNLSSSTHDLYDFRYGQDSSIEDLSDSTSTSTSELGHSEHGHSSSDHSFYESPSIPKIVPSHQLAVSGQRFGHEHHEGVSSAFGLMSLDDPNVLAGIAPDGTPFFTNVNGNGNNDTSVPARDNMLANVGLKSFPTTKHEEDSHELNGSASNGLSSRESEMRESRDFWKQYLRTPLTGPHVNGAGFPLATPTPNNLHGHEHGGDSVSKSSISKKLVRVASLPSVKTPDVGPVGHTLTNSYYVPVSHGDPGPEKASASTQPARAHTYLHTQLEQEDLKSYEQAVLARKTPTLNLVPRRRNTNSNTAHCLSGGRFSNPSTISSRHIVPQSNSNVVGRTTSSPDHLFNSRPSSAGSNESERAAARRPSFKRLPSTTLGPTNTKRALLSVSEGDWSTSSEAVNMPRAVRDADIRARGILGVGLTSEPTSGVVDLQTSTNGA